VRHVESRCDLLLLRNVCYTSGIEVMLGCVKFLHAQGLGGILWVVGTITAQNMKHSGRSYTQLHFHKSNLYVKTDSRILLNTKSDDRDSGFFSNTAVTNLIHSKSLH